MRTAKLRSRLVDDLLAALEVKAPDKESEEEYQLIRTAAAAALGELEEPKAIPALISKLGDARFGKADRIAAATALARIGKPAAPPLMDLISRGEGGDPFRESDEKEAASQILGTIGGDEVRDFLMSGLEGSVDLYATEGGDWYTASRYNETLRRVADRSLTLRLVALVEGPDRSKRIAAAGILGGTGDSAAVGHLLPLCDDGDRHVYLAALKGLASIGDTDSVHALVRALGSSHQEVRTLTRAILVASKVRAVEPLVAALMQEDDRQIQQWAGWTLNDMGLGRKLVALLSDETEPKLFVEEASTWLGGDTE